MRVIDEVLGKIFLQKRVGDHSFLKLLYDYHEIKHFDISHVRKLAKIMLNKAFISSLFDTFHYKDIKVHI